jgi:diguanylate cyclase (GGDEF)-like protein
MTLRLHTSRLAFFAAILIFILSCGKKSDNNREFSIYESFVDIPGVTSEEISAIEALKKKHKSFSYGMTHTTEAFISESGEIEGYAAFFCEWLTRIFDVQFKPEIHAGNNLLEKLDSGELDFIGDMPISEERKQIYHMTDAIAERQYIAEDTMEFFLPLAFNPVSMATANAEFKPVISVVTKALRGGAKSHLNYLFNQGDEAHKKHKFSTLLSKEEKEYLRNTVSVPMVARYFNYPVDYYNTYEDRWEGLAFDVLREVEKLTGLTFMVINGKNADLPELYEMVRKGEAHIVPELLISNERKEHYIWTEHKIIKDQYALISKSQLPNASSNEISNMRIGFIKNTVRAQMFQTWFPNVKNATEYETDESAMFALERGEVDMVMSSKNRLISYLNYYGLSDYKANYLFNHPYESSFGFSKDQAILRSIVDKALSLVNTHTITEQWMTKTYDYKTKLMEAQRPWLIGTIILSFIVLALILALFIRSHSEEKRLKKLVKKRTSEIEEQRKQLERMSLTDQLTGLPNRRNFDMRLNMEWRSAIRAKEVVSILMLDIDHFKEYNDTYGHLQGDEALCIISRTIEQVLKRSNDFAARWGGEEFVVLLADTNAKGALKIAEAIRKNVEKADILLAGKDVTKLTISIGVNTHAPNPKSSQDAFISAADNELYRAKKASRSKVCSPA